MREIVPEQRVLAGMSPAPYRPHVRTLQWLLAEKDYLLDLERRLHADQWREHRRYKNQLVYAQKWLLAEARWYAKVADEIAGTILGPRTNPLPWEGQHGDQRR